MPPLWFILTLGSSKGAADVKLIGIMEVNPEPIINVINALIIIIFFILIYWNNPDLSYGC